MSAATDHPEAPLFADGLGDRVVTVDGATGELLQVLHLKAELTSVPSFEFALRERAARLANFRHASYARVRRIDRTMGQGAALAIVSEHVEGTRLSELLRVAQERSLPLDLNAALCLIQQLVPAVALLHENARDAAHGLIAPERIVVTPQGRLVIVEHVLGAAIEQLQFGRDRLWQEFRIAMPATAGLPRFDHRADVAGIGLVALALMLGRPLAGEEYPHRIGALLNETQARVGGATVPLSAAFRAWIARALQLDVRRAFASASDAAAGLEDALSSEPQYVAAPVALEMFLSRFTAALLEPGPSAPPEPEPPVQPVQPVQELPKPKAEPASTVQTVQVVAKVQAPPVKSEPAPIADLTELIEVADLAPAGPAPAEPPAVASPLFNPDAPFTAPAPPPATPAPTRRRSSLKLMLAMAAVLLVVGGGGYYAWKRPVAGTAVPAFGTLVVHSNPEGVPVFVDGVDRGVTPARLQLAAGSHILELRRGVPRVIPLNVTAGAEISQYLEFAETPLLGQLAVQSEPAGAKVFVDGTLRGVAPVTVPDLEPGEHEVVLQTEAATSKHAVTVQAGVMASLVVPIAGATAGPVSGWVALKAPFRVEIHENGRLLGTTDADRLMLAAGRHELELVNDALGYRVTRVVQVPPGQTASLTLELPKGTVNLNATPWAEVWIDGQRVGETPIGNLSVAIGSHEVVFRHPQLGEKRHAISVTLNGPVRLSVDMK